MAWRLLSTANQTLFVSIKESLPCHFEDILSLFGPQWSGVIPCTAACRTDKHLNQPCGALLEMLLPWTPCCLQQSGDSIWWVLSVTLWASGWGSPRQKEAARDPAILNIWLRGCLHLFQPYTSSCLYVQILLCPNWKEPALIPCLPGNEFFNRVAKRKSLSFVKL